ncbi:MAG: sensor histidine kinase [Oligoflexus sp.]
MRIAQRIVSSKILQVLLLSLLGMSQVIIYHLSSREFEEGMREVQNLHYLRQQITEAQQRYRSIIRSVYSLGVKASALKGLNPPVEELAAYFQLIIDQLDETPEINSVLVHIQPNLQKTKTSHSKLIRAIQAEDPRIILLAFDNWNATQRSLDSVVEDLVQIAIIKHNLEMRRTLYWQHKVEIGFLIILAVSILFIFLAWRHFFKTIVIPLDKLNNCLVRFANGERDVVFDFHSQDEIGELSKNFDFMRKAVIGSELDLRESNSRLKRFASVAAHDLRSPIATAVSLVNFIQTMGLRDEENQDLLNRVDSVLRRSLQSVAGLLHLSMGYAVDKVSIKKPQAIVAEIISDLDLEVQKSQADIQVGEMHPLTADPNLFRELLHNLIGNSMKYRRSDLAPVIQISMKIESFQGQEFDVVLVRDNGVGFDIAEFERLKLPFERGDQKGQGFGIGLGICNDIMRSHAGYLRAESQIGQGSTFFASFPKLSTNSVDE